MYVTPERAKKFCKIEVDDDDELLAFLIDAAESHTAKFLGQGLDNYLQDNSQDSVPDLDRALEPAVELGILQHIANSYENRSDDGQVRFLPSKQAEEILHLWRVNLGV